MILPSLGRPVYRGTPRVTPRVYRGTLFEAVKGIQARNLATNIFFLYFLSTLLILLYFSSKHIENIKTYMICHELRSFSMFPKHDFKTNTVVYCPTCTEHVVNRHEGSRTRMMAIEQNLTPQFKKNSQTTENLPSMMIMPIPITRDNSAIFNICIQHSNV